MTNILNVSAAIIKPYSVGNLTATITCLNIDGAGIAKVKWSATLNGTARTVGATVTLPDAALAVPGQLVWSEVNYNYAPVVGYTITGSNFARRPDVHEPARYGTGLRWQDLQLTL
jgi:hypothetical protein